MNTLQPELGTVQETLLTPLLGRADQFGREDAIVRDAKADEMVRSMDYNFDAIRKYPDTLVGCAIRAAIFDRWMREFLKSHDDVAVTMIGEGLDTTTDRNDDGQAHFFELDFPDVIELRRHFFEPTDRRTFIAGSVFETEWIDQVKSSGRKNFLFQLAGVTMYLEPEQNRQLFTMLADHFPGCTLLFDNCSAMARFMSPRWEATVNTTKAVYKWGIGDARNIRQWDDRFVVTDLEYMMNHHRHQWSSLARFWSTIFPPLRHGYQVNRAVLG
jgi:O-methyltransferase involved in polyketide biosynthesis